MKDLISDVDKLFLSALLILFIAGCAQPSYKSDEFYEHKLKKRQVHYPYYHPGDWWARIDQDHWNEMNKECFDNCEPEYKCPTERSTMPEASRCRERRGEEHIKCDRICMEEKYRSLSIAKHIEGGYYSDGSYYATYHNNYGLFVWPTYYDYFWIRNIHPSRLKYKKTKWQKDRDECMELTDKNVKKGIFSSRYTFIKRGREYYQNCLKERGY